MEGLREFGVGREGKRAGQLGCQVGRLEELSELFNLRRWGGELGMGIGEPQVSVMVWIRGVWGERSHREDLLEAVNRDNSYEFL